MAKYSVLVIRAQPSMGVKPQQCRRGTEVITGSERDMFGRAWGVPEVRSQPWEWDGRTVTRSGEVEIAEVRVLLVDKHWCRARTWKVILSECWFHRTHRKDILPHTKYVIHIHTLNVWRTSIREFSLQNVLLHTSTTCYPLLPACHNTCAGVSLPKHNYYGRQAVGYSTPD